MVASGTGTSPIGTVGAAHPAHAYQWERYPCATLRLADLVVGAALQERPEQPAPPC